MKVLVIGAGGETGKLVVEQAIAAGHTVTALLHEGHTEKDGHDVAFPSAVEIFHGDARNPSKLEQAMTGQEAVIDTPGGTKPWAGTDLETSTARVVVDVMKRVGAKRLVVVSALGEGESKEQTTWFYEHILMPTFLRGIVADKGHMEEVVEASGVEFVIVRPPVLSDSAASGDYHVVAAGETASSMTRGDLAAFLVEQLGASAHVGLAVTVANR